MLQVADVTVHCKRAGSQGGPVVGLCIIDTCVCTAMHRVQGLTTDLILARQPSYCFPYPSPISLAYEELQEDFMKELPGAERATVAVASRCRGARKAGAVVILWRAAYVGHHPHRRPRGTLRAWWRHDSVHAGLHGWGAGTLSAPTCAEVRAELQKGWRGGASRRGCLGQQGFLAPGPWKKG